LIKKYSTTLPSGTGLPARNASIQDFLNSMKFECPHCKKEISPATMMGAYVSEKKAKSSRENGKKGGRPRKMSGHAK
jgi:hypothetical protein